MSKGILKLGGAIATAQLASAPSNPVKGTLYYDSTDNKMYIYTKDSVWREVIDQDLLDAILGSLNATPTNYTPSAATHAGHLDGIDTALATAGVDEKTKVSANDTTAGYLAEKIVAAAESNTSVVLEIKEVNDAGDEDLKIAFDESKLAHLDGGANKHDATEIDYESASKTDIQGGSVTVEAAVQDLDDNKISVTQKAANNGVASLDSGGKVPASQLPNSVMDYKGNWAASTNTPTLADGAGNAGDVYRASDAGTVDFGSGNISFEAGDLVIYSGTVWEKSPATDKVTSVNSQTGAVVLNTSHISESGNLYFTEARAKAAAVADSITDGVTDVAPSQNAVFDALATKLENVVEDTTPELGGNLDVNGKAIEGASSEIVLAGQNEVRRAKQASKTDFISEEYIHAISLLASQTGTVISALTFAHATYQAMEIVYTMKEATSGDVRVGTIRVVTNGTSVVINDLSTETAPTGVEFNAAVNGANIEISYDSGANACTMRADVKKIKV